MAMDHIFETHEIRPDRKPLARIFKIYNPAGQPIYFRLKTPAKQKRGAIAAVTQGYWTPIHRGPDHWRGETGN